MDSNVPIRKVSAPKTLKKQSGKKQSDKPSALTEKMMLLTKKSKHLIKRKKLLKLNLYICYCWMKYFSLLVCLTRY